MHIVPANPERIRKQRTDAFLGIRQAAVAANLDLFIVKPVARVVFGNLDIGARVRTEGNNAVMIPVDIPFVQNLTIRIRVADI